MGIMPIPHEIGQTFPLAAGLRSKLILDLLKALGADPLAVEEHNVIRISAENAGWGIFLKNDSFIVNKNFNGVLNVDIKRTTDLDRENYTSKLVDSAYYAGRFHKVNLLYCVYVAIIPQDSRFVNIF